MCGGDLGATYVAELSSKSESGYPAYKTLRRIGEVLRYLHLLGRARCCSPFNGSRILDDKFNKYYKQVNGWVGHSQVLNTRDKTANTRMRLKRKLSLRSEPTSVCWGKINSQSQLPNGKRTELRANERRFFRA